MSAERSKRSSSGCTATWGVLLGALLLTTAGCGSERDATVERVAKDFYAAVAREDGAAACELLAPTTRDELAQSSGTPCSTAVLEQDVPAAGEAQGVNVYGAAGKVELDGDTAFLGEFPEGWRVTAVACTARPSEPYDCQVAGG